LPVLKREPTLKLSSTWKTTRLHIH